MDVNLNDILVSLGERTPVEVNTVLMSLCGYMVVWLELMLAASFFGSRWWARATHLQRNMTIGLMFIFPPTFLFMAGVLAAERWHHPAWNI